MMSLLGDLIGVADQLTQDLGLQADVTYYAFLSADGAGKRNYAAPVPLKAIVDQKQRVVRDKEGEQVVSLAYLAFLRPMTLNEFDKIVLPDGSTGPIIVTDGFVDASNAGVLKEVYLSAIP